MARVVRTVHENDVHIEIADRSADDALRNLTSIALLRSGPGAYVKLRTAARV